MTGVSVSETLQNGNLIPASFSDVCKEIGSVPKYKIKIYSSDCYARNYRIVHVYYIHLLGEDPSFIRKFMATKFISDLTSYEDGKHISNMITFSFPMSMQEMNYFKGFICNLVENNPEFYAMVQYFNVVQFSYNPSGNSVVMSRQEYS